MSDEAGAPVPPHRPGPGRRAPLDAWLASAAAPAAPPADTGDVLRPLSFAQERHWLLERVRPGDPSLRAHIALELHGRLEEDLLRRAGARLIERHPMLRTVLDPTTEPVSLRPLDPAEAATASWDPQAPESDLPADLEHGPPLRARLLRWAPERHELHLTVHQVVCDGTSASIIVRDLMELYEAEVEHRRPRLPVLDADPTLVGAGERRRLPDSARAEQRRLAGERLAGAARLALPFPAGHASPAVTEFGCDLDARELAAVAAAARQANATAFVLFYTALGLVLADLAQTAGPLIFAAVTGRDRPELAEAVGFFTNLVPLRTAVPADATLAAAARQHRATVLDALTRLVLPPATLAQVASLAVAGNPFQVLLTHAVPRRMPATAGGLRWRRLPSSEPEWFELHLFVTQQPDATRLLLRSRDAVDPGQLASIGHALRATLRALGERPGDRAAVPVPALRPPAPPPAGPAAASPAAASPAAASPAATSPATSPAATSPAAGSPAATVMARLLGLAGMAEDADFAALGGSSLLVPRLAVELERQFGVAFPLGRLAGTGLTPATVTALAAALRRGATTDAGPRAPAEERLDPRIRPGRARRTPVRRRLLLTGATGFLGSHVLCALLRRDGVDVVCVVRGPEAGSARISSTFERLRLPTDGLDRVGVLAGDLAEPLIGLGGARFAATAAGIDGIVHCGAWVNFVYPYETLRPANVGGTQEMLRLAARCGAPVHVVSTAGVVAAAPGAARTGEASTPVDAASAAAGKGTPPSTGYATSKRVAEQLGREAARRGMAVSIIRPGWLAGNAGTGTCRARDFVWSLLAACAECGLAPDTDFPLELTTVEDAAELIARVVDRDMSGVVNIPARYATDLRAMVDLLGRTGQRIELIPLDAWRREIMAAIVAGRARPLAGFLSLLSDWSPAPLPVLDTSRARALLSPPGEPPLDTLVPRWLSAAMGTDWPPAAAR